MDSISTCISSSSKANSAVPDIPWENNPIVDFVSNRVYWFAGATYLLPGNIKSKDENMKEWNNMDIVGRCAFVSSARVIDSREYRNDIGDEIKKSGEYSTFRRNCPPSPFYTYLSTKHAEGEKYWVASMMLSTSNSGIDLIITEMPGSATSKAVRPKCDARLLGPCSFIELSETQLFINDFIDGELSIPTATMIDMENTHGATLFIMAFRRRMTEPTKIGEIMPQFLEYLAARSADPRVTFSCKDRRKLSKIHRQLRSFNLPKQVLLGKFAETLLGLKSAYDYGSAKLS